MFVLCGLQVSLEKWIIRARWWFRSFCSLWTYHFQKSLVRKLLRFAAKVLCLFFIRFSQAVRNLRWYAVGRDWRLFATLAFNMAAIQRNEGILWASQGLGLYVQVDLGGVYDEKGRHESRFLSSSWDFFMIQRISWQHWPAWSHNKGQRLSVFAPLESFSLASGLAEAIDRCQSGSSRETSSLLAAYECVGWCPQAEARGCRSEFPPKTWSGTDGRVSGERLDQVSSSDVHHAVCFWERGFPAAGLDLLFTELGLYIILIICLPRPCPMRSNGTNLILSCQR